MVNLYVNLMVLRYAQIADKALFLGVSVRGFWDEINIRIGRLSKVGCPSWASEPHSIRWKPEQNKRLSEKEFSCSSSLSLSWDIDHLLQAHPWTHTIASLRSGFRTNVSQYLIINVFINTCLYVLLVLFLCRSLIHRQAREALRWLGLSALLHIVTMTCTPRLACWRTPGTSATARQQPAVPFGIWMNLVKVRITSYAQPDLPAHRLMSWIQFFLKFILQSFITPLL